MGRGGASSTAVSSSASRRRRACGWSAWRAGCRSLSAGSPLGPGRRASCAHLDGRGLRVNILSGARGSRACVEMALVRVRANSRWEPALASELEPQLMRFISCTTKSSSCVISPCVSKRTDDDGNVTYHRRRASPTLPTLPRAITPEHMDIANLYRWRKRILLVEDSEDEWDMVALK